MSAPPPTPTDDEKGINASLDTSPKSSVKLGHVANKNSSSWLVRANARIVAVRFLEERGIQRVPEDARDTASVMGYVQMALLWFSINLTANNIAVGLLGPLVYDLSFVDSALCAVFGGMLGGAGAAYMSTYGPQSGNRTMVVARYFMGYYPSKLACVLNIIIMLGYGLIDCLIGGQILSAVSGGSLSVIVGIIIIAVISWGVAVFGMRIFHLYERWAGLPQLIVLFVLFGCAGPKFDTAIPSTGNPETIHANRLSFFSLCLSAPVAWAPSAADYYVYYPASTQKWKTFFMTFAGLALSFSMTYLMGAGLASGTFTNPDWDSAYNVSAGALLLAGFNGLGGFGKFCGVILALGLIANNMSSSVPSEHVSVLPEGGSKVTPTISHCNGLEANHQNEKGAPIMMDSFRLPLIKVAMAIETYVNQNPVPGTYSAALGFQIMGRRLAYLPRWLWVCISVLIYTACALGGRNSLFSIFENFLALMGYWVTFFLAIVLEEDLMFRKKGYNWADWAEPAKLPIGFAALITFLTGWAWAVVSMDQNWFVGPIAKQIGDYGADLGLWTGFGWALICFPPLRWLELKKIGR